MLTQFFLMFSLFLFFFKIASRIRYEITSGNIGGAFAVKNMTGAIYVAGALDYETRKRVSTTSDYFFFFEFFF